MPLNWTCLNCGEYNPPQREQCWQCDHYRPAKGVFSGIFEHLCNWQLLERSSIIMPPVSAPDEKPSIWKKPFVLFSLTLLAFIFLGWIFMIVVGGASWVELGILLFVLFFHECGHYLGMQLLGYRDVKMFFIPLFGAAVSGVSINTPVVNEVLVLLLGPVPGLLLGYSIGIVYLINGNELLLTAATYLVLLNGLNLLPLYPLDGGRIVLEILGNRTARGDSWLQGILTFLFTGFAIWRGWSGSLGIAIGMFIRTKQITTSRRLEYRMRDAGAVLRANTQYPMTYNHAYAAITMVKKALPDLDNDKHVAHQVVAMYRKASTCYLNPQERVMLGLTYLLLIASFAGVWHLFETTSWFQPEPIAHSLQLFLGI